MSTAWRRRRRAALTQVAGLLDSKDGDVFVFAGQDSACGPVAEGVFARMPGLQRILIVDKRRFDRHWLTLWAQTVTTVWDLAVDLRGSALTLLLPVRRRAIMRAGRRPGHRLPASGGHAEAGRATAARHMDKCGGTGRGPPPCCRKAARSWRWGRPPTGPARCGRPTASPRCSARAA